MAVGAKNLAFRCRVPVLATLVLCAAFARTPLTLEEAGSRRAPDFTPIHAGESVTVKGVVSNRAVSFIEYAHLPIEDGRYGLVLEGSGETLARLAPGDEVEVTGVISTRGGLPVLSTKDIRVISKQPVPVGRTVTTDELQGSRYFGQVVSTEGRVIEIGENAGGAYMLIGDTKNPYRLFAPFSPQDRSASFAAFEVDDKVRATGIASQYCMTLPYNRWYQLVVPRTSQVVRLGSRPFIRPRTVAMAVIGLLLVSFAWWRRERRLRLHREMMRSTFALGEEMMDAASSTEILKRIASTLPRIFKITHVNLYVLNRATKTLDSVASGPPGEMVSIRLEAPANGTQSGVVACFQNRALLAVPDTSRSPFAASGGGEEPAPRALLFVPMFAQGDLIGVLEMNHDFRQRHFSPDEQAVAQHLANQIGLAIKFLEQRSMREQLFRSEKLAAVGRLISGVVNELQAPLASISRTADLTLANPLPPAVARDLRAMSAESRRASEIVTRLVSFAKAEQAEAKPVELNQLLRSLIEFREREWKARGIQVRDNLLDAALHVIGTQGQLEQVFLNLLVHAEQSVADVPEKVIVLRTSLLAKRVMIEISYNGPSTESLEDPFSKAAEGDNSALGLGLCRSIIAGHGGEIRFSHPPGSNPRFELEFPWTAVESQATTSRKDAAKSGQLMTALLMEPEESVQRQLLNIMSSRGYRVVPARSAEVGLDLAQRMRFDIAFCSVRLPGLNWVELSERIQRQVTCFVLLSDGYDPVLAANFRGEGRFVLPKPIDERHLDRVLAYAEKPISLRPVVAI